MGVYLVYVLRDQLSTENLFRAIRQVRQRARDGADNVMYNTTICRIYFEYVKYIEEGGEEALGSDDDEMDVDREPQPKKRKGTVQLALTFIDMLLMHSLK